ncbi:hypothetical protein PMAYCL1PPCAC_11294, partial [Pristionchus mayeri]
MMLVRSPEGVLRGLLLFRRCLTRITPLIVVLLLSSEIYCALCVAIPYYLKGTKHRWLYYLLYPLLGFLLVHVLFHYYRLFSTRSSYRQLRSDVNRDDYCPSCDHCVSGLYDHAPFLGVCIGLQNGRHFLALLVYSIICSIVAAAVTVPLAFQLLWEPSLLYRICSESHLGVLSVVFCHSWDSSQSFMLAYLMTAAAAVSIAVSLVPVLLLYMRFIVNGWSFRKPDSRSWVSLLDRNFFQRFLRLSDRLQYSTLLATILIPNRFSPCDE